MTAKKKAPAKAKKPAAKKPAKPRTKKPDHAPRPAAPEAKAVPVTLEVSPFLLTNHDAPRRPRLIYPIAAIVTAVVLFAAVCYVF